MRTPAALVALSVASVCSAQVVLNEVFENPPNGGDQAWEFIELYGPAGYDLSGYAVALVKGGSDEDGDEVPDGASMQKRPALEEVFSLDGWSIGPNGYFVLYNSEQFGATGMDQFLLPNPDYKFFLPEGVDNVRFFDGASFGALHIPSNDGAGKLGNEESSTYVLVRRRPGHELDESGFSVYGSDYAWRKNTNADIDYNSRLDFGDEHTFGVVTYPAGVDAAVLEPVQIVDELAWSNAGGKEYNIPGRGINSNELSETPGFNPDAVSRVRYYSTNPMIGWTVQESSGELRRTSIADESWIYGETRDYGLGSEPDADDLQPGEEGFTQYRPEQITFFDEMAPGEFDEMNWMAPIDPDGPRYSYFGPGDFNPLSAPFFGDSGARDASGDLVFEPYSIVGFEVTPGGPNDTPPETDLVGTAIETQFRWVAGDFDFDGDVDCEDAAMIQASLGASLDDTAMLTRDYSTDDPSDDTVYEGWAHQLQDFNALLAMMRMDLTDGTTGEWDTGVTVTQADLDAHALLVPSGSAADLDGSGTVGSGDLGALLAAWGSSGGPGDFDGSGTVGSGDLGILLAAWGEPGGCP